MEEKQWRHKGFPLLFSAQRASPSPPQCTTSTLANYCSTMHNTSARLWRAFLRRNDITEKKKITYGPQHQRGATALGFISEHESSGGRQLSWLWFGRCDASQDTVRINEMSRSKELSKNTQHFINCTSGTFYVLGKQRRQMDFMFHCWSKSGSQDFSLSSITNQRLPPIMWSSDASLAWQYWHVMQFSISWISKSSKNSIL